MDKKKVLEAMIETIRKELEVMTRAALHARESAISDEVKSQDKYDTQSVEASYLAGAQAQRSTELQTALTMLERLLDKLSTTSPVIVDGSIIELENLKRSSQHVYILLPKEGGRKLQTDEGIIFSLSSSSPLGEELIGRKAGESFEVEIDGRDFEYSILKVL